jgi:hypothetical protein
MGVIFDILMSLLPGIGAATILDKVAADKVPNYPSGGIGPKNLVWFIAAAVAGAFAFRFIAKKLHLKIR